MLSLLCLLLRFTITENCQAPVLLAFDHLHPKYVAIKGAVDMFATLPKAKRILRELKFSIRLSGHPNLAFLHNVLVPSDVQAFTGIFMVFDMVRCDLSSRLAEGCAVAQAEARNRAMGLAKGLGARVGKPVTGRLVKRWMYELLMGLSYMHMSGVLHRDIKPANLLVDENDHLRICDLGCVWCIFRGAWCAVQLALLWSIGARRVCPQPLACSTRVSRSLYLTYSSM